MTKQIAQQAASLVLAAVMTLGALATVNTVADIERHAGFAHESIAQAATQAAAKT